MSKITIVTRESSTKNVEGHATGMNSKYWNATRAVDMKLTHTLEDVNSGIVIIDPLWVWQYEDTQERWEALQKLNAIKIVWAEEQEFLRLPRDRRMALYNHVDLTTTCNKFLQALLLEFGIKNDILYTHIDEGFYKPEEKSPLVMAGGQVSYEKGTHRIIELFKELKCEKVFVGNAELWGKEPPQHQGVRFEARKALERELSNVCDHISYADRNEMCKLYSTAAVYVNLSRYDVGCLSVLEAGMSGCHLVLWDQHRQFDEYYNVCRSSNKDYTFAKITELIETPKVNEAIRDEMIKKHGQKAFRANLTNIVSKTMGLV